MTFKKEKGRPGEGSPIPKIIPAKEHSEFSEFSRKLQALKLVRRCAINTAMAEVLAPMVFGVLS